MVNENAEEVEALNAYTYSVDSAIEELEKGGWGVRQDQIQGDNASLPHSHF